MSIPTKIGLAGIVGLCVISSPLALAKAAPGPVYIHLNMESTSMILEDKVAVRPGQKVVFINQDNDIHTIIGYNPQTGAAIERVDGSLYAAAGHTISSYTVDFMHQGFHYYYCTVHAYLKKQPGKGYIPEIRPSVHGFGSPMAGLIIVTTNKKLLAENPKTTSEKILPPLMRMKMK